MTGNHLKHLLGVLNSKLVTWYFHHCIGTTSGVGTNRWLKYTIEQIPIVKVNKDLGALVSSISKQYEENTNSEIDNLICRLYTLTNEETEYIING